MEVASKFSYLGPLLTSFLPLLPYLEKVQAQFSVLARPSCLKSLISTFLTTYFQRIKSVSKPYQKLQNLFVPSSVSPEAYSSFGIFQGTSGQSLQIHSRSYTLSFPVQSHNLSWICTGFHGTISHSLIFMRWLQPVFADLWIVHGYLTFLKLNQNILLIPTRATYPACFFWQNHPKQNYFFQCDRKF